MRLDAADILHLLETDEVLIQLLSTKVLDGYIAEIERRERLAYLIAGGRMVELELDDAAALEIDAVIEAEQEQTNDRGQVYQG
jgi:hypothetical protein